MAHSDLCKRTFYWPVWHHDPVVNSWMGRFSYWMMKTIFIQHLWDGAVVPPNIVTGDFWCHCDPNSVTVHMIWELMNPCKQHSEGPLKFYQYTKKCIIRYSGPIHLRRNSLQISFIHLHILFRQIWSIVDMKRLKTLGKFQECFLNVSVRKLLVLLYNSAKISNLHNNFGMLIRKEPRKNKGTCGHH